MIRLPPRPRLTWKQDGTPVDERVGDVYYSVEDGLAECRAVFLAGCRLPEAWTDRASFTIAELGFGTGLNFLATWQMWRAHRNGRAWLHFVSFEGYPLDREDVARALKPWPELAELTDKLCARWPVRAKGVQQVTWPDERLSLTLHIGDIAETLPRSGFKADAWFLDGFSPARNEAMWGEALWPLIAARSHRGTSAATFTVAGAVRRGLADAGFHVEKQPGHGRKRERLEAVFAAGERPTEPTQTPRVAIIGAGISGACLASTLTQRGASVTVFDASDGPAQGTSGNPLALVMPRLDASDTVQARLLIEAYLSAQTFYRGLPGTAEAETVHHPRDDGEAQRFAKLLADPPLGLEQLEAIRGGGLLYKASVILRPADLLPGLLKEIDVRWGTTSQTDLRAREVNGERFDAIVLATGWQMAAALPALDLTGRLGQVESFASDTDAPPRALASGAYALACGQTRLWGATFANHAGGDAQVSQLARDENAAALEQLAPYWLAEARKASIESRAGIRATTADRLPLIGPCPDAAAIDADRQALERAAWTVAPDAYAMNGIHVAGGYGSRGFTWAPWAAALLTASLFGDPVPAAADTLRAIAPNRLILRNLKRVRG